MFVQGQGDVRTAFRDGHSARLVQSRAIGHTADETMDLSAIRFVHPALNIAAFETPTILAGGPEEPSKGLVIAATAPPDLVDRAVAVIGVAERDALRNPKGIPEIFGSEFGHLLVQPGYVLGTKPDGPGTTQLLHDCSTIGGSGGGPVLDLQTGDILAFHMGGMFLHQNYAVPAWELARDPRVRRHGLTFSDEPAWQRQWIEAELREPPAETPPSKPARGVRHLAHKEALALIDVLIDAGFGHADKQPGLFFGMDPQFLASLPTGGSPADRLRGTIDLLNRTPALTTGEVPMEILLMNAANQSRPLIQSTDLEGFLERLRKGTPSKALPRRE